MNEIQAVDELAATAFRRHYRQVYRYVRRRLRTDADAEDVAADVFADAAAALERFAPGETPILAWLYTIARRRLADEARRNARTPAPLAAVDSAPEYGPDLARVLRTVLRRLPEQQRVIVVLKLFEGRTFREIAERLDTTEPACKMRLMRALERVRDELQKEGIEP